ncbi:hypothetical protein C8A01DRAFT_14919 [Parachaetomium inaequale]|uniref:Uncharacterized protein n=1 Tax=Parachaetomium inaequale TaxID=2588326 RepID=A0AAN6PM06_9PEZI|nr:hypothetical protein C8A01DRAFT_14919 [Parachaetomium inaequale]
MAPMAFSKTYFSIPTTIYKPDDLIQLGQVIKDPAIPFERLAPPPKLEGALKPRISSLKEVVVTSTKTRAVSVGLSAQVLEFINGELSAEKSSGETLTWEAAEVETRYFEPAEDEEALIAQICTHKAVRQVLKRFGGFGQSAYMVTGLKIALRPGLIRQQGDQGTGVSGQLKAVVSPEGAVQAGFQAGSTRSVGTSVEGTATDSYVFAYQLRKISVSRLTGKTTIGGQVKGGDLYGIGGGGSESDSDDSLGEDDDLEDEALELDGDFSIDKEDYGSKLPGAVFEKREVDLGDDGTYLLVSAKS